MSLTNQIFGHAKIPSSQLSCQTVII